MFRTLVFSAAGAALFACLAVSALQFLTTEPLILHAEGFEGAAAPAEAHRHAAATHAGEHAHDTAPGHHHGEDVWAPADGLERTLFTVLANLVTGLAVSLVLVGLMVLGGGAIDARSGLLWGIGGFAAASLLPALGLPPELPGTPAADIVDRQIWWLGTVLASAAGLGLIAFAGHWAVKLLGLALLVAPHVVGAPPPPSHEVAYPGALAGEFVVASLMVSAVLWCVAGAAVGWLYRRLAPAA